MAEEKGKAEKIAHESDFPNAIHSLEVAIRQHDINLLRNLQICFPACIYSYDRHTHKAKVMPLVKQGFFQGEWYYINRQTYEVTVHSIHCGGFTIDFPLYVGDTGWVISSDRETMLVKAQQSPSTVVLEGDRTTKCLEDYYQQVQKQNTLHSFADGFFIPDNWGRWENYRYKDNLGISLADAFYLGASIDTEDEDRSMDAQYRQQGKSYEDKSSSSIVIQRSGGTYLLSSSKKDEKGNTKNAKIAVVDGSAEISVADHTEGNPYSSSIKMDTENGIAIRQDNNKDQVHFIASVDKGKLTARLTDVKRKQFVSLTFSQGVLDISTTDAINVMAQGNVNIKSAKDAYIAAENARVVAKENASVAADTVSASAAKNINIAAGEKINIAGGKKLNVTSGRGIDIVTLSDVKVMAKGKGASVVVSTLSKDSQVGLVTKGSNSVIALQSEGAESQINVHAQGEKSSISIDAEGGDVTVAGDNNVNIVSKQIDLTGHVSITEGLDLNGIPVRYDAASGHWGGG